MKDPHQFDDLYQDARRRLLLQTYALTGDLPAARSAVRDAFVVAWHHWRKVSRLEDPEAWVRPHAWAHAQRRQTARIWHRDKRLDPEAKATLDALGKLSMQQRRVLLLSHLSTASLPDLARELGLPRSTAERELQTASAHFSLHRGVPSSSIRAALQPLAEIVDEVRWPRSTIIRRSGATRRRTHAGLGVAAAVAALFVTGSLVTQTEGIRPSLTREHVSGEESPSATSPEPPGPRLLPEGLLTADQVARLAPARTWRRPTTDDNTRGDGLVLPCQRARFADPDGVGALQRTFRSRTPPGQTRISATQFSELSDTKRAARAAFRTTVEWYSGCTDDRVQLLSTNRVPAVGDEAMLFVLRSWERPATTVTVGIARTGLFTTSTVRSVKGVEDSGVDPMGSLLAASVNALCGTPGTGGCAGPPRVVGAAPLPVGDAPSMLSDVDLPPVSTVQEPWIGTKARKANLNVASTSCDRTVFTQPPMKNNMTRTFLIPGAKLPAAFGLTETVGRLPGLPQARGFVKQIRGRMNGCEDEDLGTQVDLVAQRSTVKQDLSVWRVSTEVSDQASVRFLMGIVRNGNSVAQVGFVPSGRVDMSSDAFLALAVRALERVGRLSATRTPAKTKR